MLHILIHSDGTSTVADYDAEAKQDDRVLWRGRVNGSHGGDWRKLALEVVQASYRHPEGNSKA